MTTGVDGTEPKYSTARIRLLIVDDQQHFRLGLRTALETSSSAIVVVGEAASGTEAIERARQLRPDVVLMDLRMPDLDGITATRAIRAFVPGVRVLMLTVSDRPEDVALATQAGADGYLLKERSLVEIEEAILAIVRGQTWPRAAAR